MHPGPREFSQQISKVGKASATLSYTVDFLISSHPKNSSSRNFLLSKTIPDNSFLFFRLVFNSTTGLSSNMPGVDIRVPGFGGTSSIEWLDKSKASPGSYFSALVGMMTTWGYQSGKSVQGAPYDWRRSPSQRRFSF
ncbi:hypothetical protein Y032_0003g1199 [Ancylostoma ceylanicum]|nr:hypothetical protein Y032_0003g1199 [Ancylostoma ceylanicum]